MPVGGAAARDNLLERLSTTNVLTEHQRYRRTTGKRQTLRGKDRPKMAHSM